VSLREPEIRNPKLEIRNKFKQMEVEEIDKPQKGICGRTGILVRVHPYFYFLTVSRAAQTFGAPSKPPRRDKRRENKLSEISASVAPLRFYWPRKLVAAPLRCV
jgi:hypothetical protein